MRKKTVTSSLPLALLLAAAGFAVEYAFLQSELHFASAEGFPCWRAVSTSLT